MQKLMASAGRFRTSQTGSILAPVVAISAILTLAIGGFLGLARNNTVQEVLSLNEDQAFIAAETGLILGSKWVLSQQASWPQNAEHADIFGETLRGSGAVNGMDLTVSAAFFGKMATVTSVARNPAYPSQVKRISHEMRQTQLSSGEFGIYLFNAYQFDGNTKGLRKMERDGPAHFNTALQLGNPGDGNNVVFNDRVTMFNIDPATNEPVVNLENPIGHFGNDYRYGLEGGDSDHDNEFLRTYNPFANKVEPQFDTTKSHSISLNSSDNSLTFGVEGGVPQYIFTDDAGTVQTVNYDPDMELKLRVINSAASVSGVVKGKVTVYTDPGKDICLPGDLTYHDFSATCFANSDTGSNSGYGYSSKNVLGLYSGSDFIIPEGTHNITAQLFSVDLTYGTVRFDVDKSNATSLFLFGTLATNAFWDPKQGNDQAYFKQVWDRRMLPAPGLGFKHLDDAGAIIVTADYSNWIESNSP